MDNNRFADALAFLASMMIYPTIRYLKITTLFAPSIMKEYKVSTMMIEEENEKDEEGEEGEKEDWRCELHAYLEKGEVPKGRLEAHNIKSRRLIMS